MRFSSEDCKKKNVGLSSEDCGKNFRQMIARKKMKNWLKDGDLDAENCKKI